VVTEETVSMECDAAPLPVVVATGNPGKAREFGRLLGASFDVRVKPDGASEAEETGTTFAENARLKALSVFAALGGTLAVLADDSGLEVDCLGGSPGIRSARFAGEEATDAENVERLLAEMAGSSERHARFVCHLALLLPRKNCSDSSGGLLEAEGSLEGTIESVPRGAEGFGYDPVFRPAGWDKTLSEVSPGEKDAASHRARAVKVLLHLMEEKGMLSCGA